MIDAFKIPISCITLKAFNSITSISLSDIEQMTCFEVGFVSLCQYSNDWIDLIEPACVAGTFSLETVTLKNSSTESGYYTVIFDVPYCLPSTCKKDDADKIFLDKISIESGEKQIGMRAAKWTLILVAYILQVLLFQTAFLTNVWKFVRGRKIVLCLIISFFDVITGAIACAALAKARVSILFLIYRNISIYALFFLVLSFTFWTMLTNESEVSNLQNESWCTRQSGLISFILASSAFVLVLSLNFSPYANFLMALFVFSSLLCMSFFIWKSDPENKNIYMVGYTFSMVLVILVVIASFIYNLTFLLLIDIFIRLFFVLMMGFLPWGGFTSTSSTNFTSTKPRNPSLVKI